MVPEILMHPSDIGMNQAGIPEAIVQSVLECDPGTYLLFLFYFFNL
jgi:actin-related protein 6